MASAEAAERLLLQVLAGQYCIAKVPRWLIATELDHSSAEQHHPLCPEVASGKLCLEAAESGQDCQLAAAGRQRKVTGYLEQLTQSARFELL